MRSFANSSTGCCLTFAGRTSLHRTRRSLMRAMPLEFPDDPACATLTASTCWVGFVPGCASLSGQSLGRVVRAGRAMDPVT